MWLFIGGVATGIILTLVVIVFLANVTGEGVYDFPPDPTYHPAGWKEWHEARQGTPPPSVRSGNKFGPKKRDETC